MLIDGGISGDRNVVKKDAEILKYKDIIIEIQRMWNVGEKVIPVTVGDCDWNHLKITRNIPVQRAGKARN
jgi:hypothetical protein